MKKIAILFGVGLCVLFFAGCPSPVTPTTSTTTIATPQAPTVANLTGTWAQDLTTVTSSSGNTITNTLVATSVYGADSSLSVSGISTTIVTGSSPATSTNYLEYKGTYSTDGNQVTVNYTEMRSSATAFPDTEIGWASFPYSSTASRLIVGNKFYPICSPIGSFSGIVGDWELNVYSNINGTSAYSKMVFTFASDGTVTNNIYASSTSTFTAAPISTINGTYSNNNDGTYSISGTIYSSVPSISSVAIVGGYLVFPNLYATKQ